METASSPAERRTIGRWCGRCNVPRYGAISFNITKGISTAKGSHESARYIKPSAKVVQLMRGIFLPIFDSY